MSLREFLEMGGYAFYVWGSYGVAAALLLLEVVTLIRRRRTLLQRLGRITRGTTTIGTGHETQA